MTANVNQNNIPYNPIYQNSNSFAHQLIKDLGFARPAPPDGVSAPRHQQWIPSYNTAEENKKRDAELKRSEEEERRRQELKDQIDKALWGGPVVRT